MKHQWQRKTRSYLARGAMIDETWQECTRCGRASAGEKLTPIERDEECPA